MYVRKFLFILALACPCATSAQTLSDMEIRIIASVDSVKVFGSITENLHVPDSQVSLAVSDFLGPSQEGPTSKDAITFLVACRAGSCDEKISVAVSTKDRRLIGTAFRNFHCRFNVMNTSEITKFVESGARNAPVVCDKQPMLSAFIVRRTIDSFALEQERKVLDHFREFATALGVTREEVRVIHSP